MLNYLYVRKHLFTPSDRRAHWLPHIQAVPYSDDDDEASKISIADACSLTTSEYGLLTGYGFSATFGETSGP